MRFTTTLLTFVFLFFGGLQAQTSITSASFPGPGDVLKTLVAVQPNGNYAVDGGENQSWDFSGLDGNVEQVVEYFDPGDAMNAGLFPNAACVQFLGQGAGEQFFESNARQFASLGIVGADLTGLGFNTNSIYDEPYVIRRVMNYDPNDVLETRATAGVRLALDDLPGGLGDSLQNLSPIPFDSIGFGISFERRDVIDGWGTLKIPGGTYEVLRETRREERKTLVEIKLPIFGWSDVSDLIGAVGGGGNFANDTTYSNVYLSNDAKEPIAVVTLSEDMQSAMSVAYKDLESSKVHIIDDGLFEMTVSPNPADGPINVIFENLPQGEYAVELFNLSGKLLERQSFSFSKNITLQESSNQLRAGVYLLSLKNAEGKLLATEKVVLK